MLIGHPDRRERAVRFFIRQTLADNLPIASHRDITCKTQVTCALPHTGAIVKKSFALAALAYLLPTFPLGYFWHLVTFHEAYERLALYRAEVIIPFGLVSMIIQALFMAWAYPKLFSTRREDWLGSAIRFFLTFGAFAWSLTTLPVAAKYNMTSVTDFLKLETAFTAVQFLVVAPLVALAYRGAPTAARAGGPLGAT